MRHVIATFFDQIIIKNNDNNSNYNNHIEKSTIMGIFISLLKYYTCIFSSVINLKNRTKAQC